MAADEREWCAACGHPVKVHFGPDLPTCSECGDDELQPTWPCWECGTDIAVTDDWMAKSDGVIVCHDCMATWRWREQQREARDQLEYAMSEDASRRRKGGL